MRLLFRFIPLIAVSCLLASCGGAKVSKTESSTYLFLSQGGGVTGKYEGYTLYPDGRVEISEGQEVQPESHGNISKGEAAKIFESWEAIGKQHRMLYKPGNMNYKIIYADGQDIQVIDWSDNQQMDTAIERFFSETFSKLKNAE